MTVTIRFPHAAWSEVDDDVARSRSQTWPFCRPAGIYIRGRREIGEASMFHLRIHSVDSPRRPRTAAEIVAGGAAAAGGSHVHDSFVLSSSPSSSSKPLSAAAAAAGSSNPSPSVQVSRGIARIFRNSSDEFASSYPIASSSPDPQQLPPLPVGFSLSSAPLFPPYVFHFSLFRKAWRRTLLFVLAIPSRFTTDDFLHFCCWPYSERLLEVRVIRYGSLLLGSQAWEGIAADMRFLCHALMRFLSATLHQEWCCWGVVQHDHHVRWPEGCRQLLLRS